MQSKAHLQKKWVGWLLREFLDFTVELWQVPSFVPTPYGAYDSDEDEIKSMQPRLQERGHLEQLVLVYTEPGKPEELFTYPQEQDVFTEFYSRKN